MAKINETKFVFLVVFAGIFAISVVAYTVFLKNTSLLVGKCVSSTIKILPVEQATAQIYIDVINEQKNGTLLIKGWCIKKGEQFKHNKSQYLLVNDVTNEVIFVKSYSTSRRDVYKNVNDADQWRARYVNAGLIGGLRKPHLTGSWRLVVHFDNGTTDEYIDTGKVITR